MDRRVIIVESEGKWAIYDALKGDPIVKRLTGLKESIDVCSARHYELPIHDEEGGFLADLDGEPLYRSERAGFEYADGTPCFDIAVCPECKGPAFGREGEQGNCYFCPNCGEDVACVPPAEWIGAVD